MKYKKKNIKIEIKYIFTQNIMKLFSKYLSKYVNLLIIEF